MKPLIDRNLQQTFARRFAEADAYFARQRQRGIELHGWSSDCDCVECGDTGINPDTHKPCWCEPGKAIREQKDRESRWQSNRDLAHHRDCRIATHPSRDAQNIARDWLETGFPAHRGLVLIGNTGTGKTGIAAGIGYELHMRGISVRFWGVSKMLDALRPGTDRDPAGTMRALLDAGLLILDDLGAEKLTEFTAERIYAIVDGRYGTSLPTIITTNLDIERLRAQTGDRVMSRLVETFTITKLGGPDLRKLRLVGAA